MKKDGAAHKNKKVCCHWVKNTYVTSYGSTETSGLQAAQWEQPESFFLESTVDLVF